MLSKLTKKELAVLLGFIFFLFYWFQIRPAKIRSDCGFTAVFEYDVDDSDMSYPDFYDFYYKKCLNQHGLIK